MTIAAPTAPTIASSTYTDDLHQAIAIARLDGIAAGLKTAHPDGASPWQILCVAMNEWPDERSHYFEAWRRSYGAGVVARKQQRKDLSVWGVG